VNGSAISCNGAGEIEIADTFFINPAYDNTFFNGADFDGATTKQVWILIDRFGDRYLEKVTGQTVPAAGLYGFQMATACDNVPSFFFHSDSTVQFIHSYADTNFSAEGDISAAPYIGIAKPQNLSELDFDFIGSPWDGFVLYPNFEPTPNTDAQLIIDAFIGMILNDTPISLPPWDFEAGQSLRLLRFD